MIFVKSSTKCSYLKSQVSITLFEVTNKVPDLSSWYTSLQVSTARVTGAVVVVYQAFWVRIKQ
jgi:hypothetical protein